MTMGRKLKMFGIAFLIILVAVCLGFVNKYLSSNHLLIYATGTSDKAFLNATWKMSPQEIERANKTTLSALFVPANRELDQNRIKVSVSEIYLWKHTARLECVFFENMLYKYFITISAYDLENTNKEILALLRERFGKEKVSTMMPDDTGVSETILNIEWDTDKQHISYKIRKIDESTVKQFFVPPYCMDIIATYKPLYKQIKEIAEKEKKSYF